MSDTVTSHNNNVSPSRRNNQSRSVSPVRNQRDSMKDILRDTNYGDRQRKNEILGSANNQTQSKKLTTLSIDSNLGQRRASEILSEYNVFPMTPSKQATIYQGFSNDAAHLRNSSHHKKFSDVTDSKLNKTPNQIKSLLYFQKNQEENNFKHKRTHSEVNITKRSDWNISVVDRNELEKTKLQNQNEYGKYYFHGEQRDARIENAIKKSEQKDQYEQNLFKEKKYNNDFKKNVAEYLEKFDKYN